MAVRKDGDFDDQFASIVSAAAMSDDFRKPFRAAICNSGELD
jgi:hypothetical protein